MYKVICKSGLTESSFLSVTRFLRYAKREHILVSETYCVINHIHRYHHPIIFAAILPPREHHYSPHDMV